MNLGQRYFDTIVQMASARWWREVILTIGAVLGVVCLVLAVASIAFDVRPLVFRSGSMAPTINAGDLAISRTVDAADLTKGDIVSVKANDGSRVTHRIVEVSHRGGSAQLTLKGDDNQVVDAQTYVVASAERVLFHVPEAGYVVSWLTGPIGLFLLGIYAAFLFMVLFGRGRGDRTKRAQDGARRTTMTGPALVLAVAGVVGMGTLRAEPTWAAWTDNSSATGGTFQAHYVQPPNSMSCTNGSPVLLGYFDGVTFGITHKNALYDYTLRVYNGSGTQVGSDYAVSSGSTAVGGTVSYTISANQMAGLLPLGGSVTVRVYSKLKAASSWTAASYRQWRVDTGLLGVLLLNGVKCGADTTGASDTTGPAIRFDAPVNGVTASRGSYQDAVRTACGSNRPGCGTVTDASGIASVSYQLKRVGNTLGTRYFHASSGAGGIWNTDETFEEAQITGTTWSFDGLITTAYASDGDFTLTVKATDKAGNVTTSSIAFTLT